MANLDTNQLKSLLDSAHSVALLLPKNPTYDAVASALALKLTLEQVGKSATVASPEPLLVEFNRLVGVNTVTQNFGKRDLVISFPGQTEMVDKVSYNVEKGELQLVVTPKAGTAGLDPSKLKFVAGGPTADLIILMGTDNLLDLGQIYEEGKEYLQSVKQYILTGATISQDVAQVLVALQMPIGADAASNLLAGLEKSTNSYQTPNVSAETFEAAANLMRHGARRHDVLSANSFPAGSIPTENSQPQAQPQVQAQPQEDWYEPKVYKGTNLS